MRAVVYSAYGGPEVLSIEDVPMPIPGPHDLLVRVHTAALNPVDWHLVRGVPFPVRMIAGGLRRPRRRRRVGGDFAGVVAGVGPAVTGFAVDDPVFGHTDGALAEYVTIRADRAVAHAPSGLTAEQAAAVPLAGLTALQMLRDHAMVRPGQHVLVVGAAGGIGTFAVQLAHLLGAHVTGVQSAGGADVVRQLGADRLIDYTTEDFTSGEVQYDAVIDNVCSRPLDDVLRVVKPGGVIVPNGGGISPDRSIRMRDMLRVMARRPFLRQRVALFVTKPNRADLQVLADFIHSGSLRPVVDRCYPMSEVQAAFRHLETGHAHGKVVVTVATQADSGRAI